MARNRTRLTARGISAVAVLALVVVGLAAVVAVKVLRPDCRVRADGREVTFDEPDAVAISGSVAAVVRADGSANAATAAVLKHLDLDIEDAAVVGAALSGRTRAALVCRYGGAGTNEEDRLSADGLTHRAEAVRDNITAAFGTLSLGGFAPGGVTDGHMPGSAHYDGRAIDVFFRPINAGSKQSGWALAQYLVANARKLSINTVIFDARIWTARKAGDGWRDYRVDRGNRSAATVRVLEHRDHVHVDVAD